VESIKAGTDVDQEEGWVPVRGTAGFCAPAGVGPIGSIVWEVLEELAKNSTR